MLENCTAVRRKSGNHAWWPLARCLRRNVLSFGPYVSRSVPTAGRLVTRDNPKGIRDSPPNKVACPANTKRLSTGFPQERWHLTPAQIGLESVGTAHIGHKVVRAAQARSAAQFSEPPWSYVRWLNCWGHRTLMMAMRYAHVAPRHMRQAVNQFVWERRDTRTSTQPLEATHRGPAFVN